MKGKTIYLNIEQGELLDYIVAMYQELHEESWKQGIHPKERGITNKILEKLTFFRGQHKFAKRSN